MHARRIAVLAILVLAACGGQSDRPPVDGGLDSSVPTDAPPDVPLDAPRVWCPDSTLDGGGMVCGPGMICGNSGGVPGNFCCYPQEAGGYYCPP